jgi:hypothetical protein
MLLLYVVLGMEIYIIHDYTFIISLLFTIHGKIIMVIGIWRTTRENRATTSVVWDALCGGQISPGSTRRLEGLTKGFGPIISQGHPFVGQGRNCWRNGLTQDWIDSGPDGSLDLSIIRSIDPIPPCSALRRRN